MASFRRQLRNEQRRPRNWALDMVPMGSESYSVKFFLNFFDVMEMKHANRLWNVGTTEFTLLIVGAIALSH